MSVFGATLGEVEGDFPSTEQNPFGGSGGVGPTVADVERWMLRGGATLESVVRARGITELSDLSEADEHALRGAVIAYATAKALMVMRRFDQSAEYMREYRDVLNSWRDRPMDLESATLKSTTYTSPRVKNQTPSRFLDGTSKW